MPVCEDCSTEFDLKPALTEPEIDFSLDEIQRFYRMIADNRPRSELLDEFYQLFGSCAELAPPYTITRIAEVCKTVRAHD